MEKLDLTKHYKSYYTAKSSPEIVEIETAQFLSILGKGDPSDKDFSDAIQAIYSTAYAIKFACKAIEKDFTVSKLEGLWWYDEIKFGSLSASDAPQKVSRSEWEYRLLIRLPEFVDNEMIQNAIQSTISKKGIQLAENIELHKMKEGKCVQILHVGPFSSEPESIQKMIVFMQDNHLERNGIHHEIYLSDFRKTEPGKLKTILREPFK